MGYVSDGLEEVTDTLTKDVGGVPVWVLGGGVGLLIAVGMWYWKSHEGGSGSVVEHQYDPSTATEEETPDPTNADYGLPNGPVGDWLSDNPGSPAYPIGTGVAAIPLTNAQWGRYVADILLGQGADPSLVTNAITKYLAGVGLTVQEKAIINQALSIKSTPEGLLGIKDAIPTPPTYRGYGWYKAKKGDTPAKVCAKYKITLAQFNDWNGGITHFPIGKWLKVRANSNPMSGYTGK